MKVQLLAAFLLVSVTLSYAELIDSSIERQIEKLKIQIDILHDLIKSECPNSLKRNEVSAHRLSTDLRLLKLHHERLVQELMRCDAAKLTTLKPTDKITTEQPTTTQITTEQPTTAQITTKQPTTTQKVITPEDCQELHENGITTPGIYTLYPKGYDSFEAWCDFDATHGWTVIQRRQDSTDFFLNWADYKEGFGQLNGSYWLGNDNIHALTRKSQKLNIFLRRYDGGEASANYSTFSVMDESDKYKLTISGYSGNAGDAVSQYNGMYFTTRDRDNDIYGGNPTNCADQYKGGWWYKNCIVANINGIYCGSGTAQHPCAVWYGSFASYSTSLTKIVMRVTRD